MNLHPVLAQDCLLIGHFPLCRLLLMQDANYPWFILVPDRAEITEVHQLSTDDQQQLMHESVILSRVLDEVFRPDKLNLAALGNVVPQLHVHHVVRYRNDPAWPDPVWGRVPHREYTQHDLQALQEKIARQLGTIPDFTFAQ